MKQIPSHSVNADQQALQYDIYDYLSTEEQIEELVKESTIKNEELRDLFFYNTSDEKYNISKSKSKYFIGFKFKNYLDSNQKRNLLIVESNDYLEIKKELQRFILLLNFFKNKKYKLTFYSRKDIIFNFKTQETISIKLKNLSNRKPNYLNIVNKLEKKLNISVCISIY